MKLSALATCMLPSIALFSCAATLAICDCARPKSEFAEYPAARPLKPRARAVWARLDDTRRSDGLHTRHAERCLLPDPIRSTSRTGVLSNVDGNNIGGWAGCDQWSTGTTPGVGRWCHFHRACDGLARYGNREHRSPRDSSRSSCQPIRGHLGSECLPDCDGRNPFADPADTGLPVSSTARHACRIFDVGSGIANEHVAIRHLDCGKRLGIKRRIGRQQAVDIKDVGGDRIDVVIA
jgi:hypothetical protein